MKIKTLLLTLFCSALLVGPVLKPFAADVRPDTTLIDTRPRKEAGFKSLFNGKDLTGWAGRPEHWSVRDGAITGITTKENPARGNNFLIAKKGGTNLIVDDFELRLSYKIVPNGAKGFGNSGIQYRSKDKGNFVVNGYQADFECGTT